MDWKVEGLDNPVTQLADGLAQFVLTPMVLVIPKDEYEAIREARDLANERNMQRFIPELGTTVGQLFALGEGIYKLNEHFIWVGHVDRVPTVQVHPLRHKQFNDDIRWYLERGHSLHDSIHEFSRQWDQIHRQEIIALIDVLGSAAVFSAPRTIPGTDATVTKQLTDAAEVGVEAFKAFRAASDDPVDEPDTPPKIRELIEISPGDLAEPAAEPTERSEPDVWPSDLPQSPPLAEDAHPIPSSSPAHTEFDEARDASNQVEHWSVQPPDPGVWSGQLPQSTPGDSAHPIPSSDNAQKGHDDAPGGTSSDGPEQSSQPSDPNAWPNEPGQSIANQGGSVAAQPYDDAPPVPPFDNAPPIRSSDDAPPIPASDGAQPVANEAGDADEAPPEDAEIDGG